MIQHIDVHAVLQQSVSGLYGDLVTRPTGRAVRERIERAMTGNSAAVTVMDFSGVGCLDYSCADEIVAKLLREEAPPSPSPLRPQVVLLRGITAAHREALEPVLAGHGLAVMLECADGSLEMLGPPVAARALLEGLVARRLASRMPGGTFALTVS